jgi:hypothetical protein
MRLWKHWTRHTGALLEEACDVLGAAGLGIAEVDMGSAVIWAGGPAGDNRYQGVQLRVSENYQIVVMAELLLQAPVSSPAEALQCLKDHCASVLALGQHHLRLTRDDDSDVWILECYRECSGKTDLTSHVLAVLQQTLVVRLGKQELQAWRELAGKQDAEGKDSTSPPPHDPRLEP